MPEQTWKNFTTRRKNGSWVFKDAENWRLLDGEAKVETEEEVTLSAKDEKKIRADHGDDEKKKDFNSYIGTAEELAINGNLEAAIAEYKKASEIYPKENYPKEQIKKLNLKLKTNN
jgi:hypothetical protein